MSGKVSPDRRRNARVGVCKAESWHPPGAMKKNATTGEPQFLGLWYKFQGSGAGSKLEQEESFVLSLRLKTQGTSKGGKLQTSTLRFGKVTLTAAWRMGDGEARLGAGQEVSQHTMN